ADHCHMGHAVIGHVVRLHHSEVADDGSPDARTGLRREAPVDAAIIAFENIRVRVKNHFARIRVWRGITAAETIDGSELTAERERSIPAKVPPPAHPRKRALSSSGWPRLKNGPLPGRRW